MDYADQPLGGVYAGFSAFATAKQLKTVSSLSESSSLLVYRVRVVGRPACLLAPMRIRKDQQQREEEEEMSSEMYERIRTNPRYKEEMAKRSRFSWTLAAIVLVIFYGFILIVAFAPEFLATPLGEGWTTTIGVPIGVGIITLFWLLTGYYVYRANKEFDVTNVQILRESEK